MHLNFSLDILEYCIQDKVIERVQYYRDILKFVANLISSFVLWAHRELYMKYYYVLPFLKTSTKIDLESHLPVVVKGISKLCV